MANREKKMLMILGIIVYIALFWALNVNTTFPSIKDHKEELSEASLKLKQLEYDFEHIDLKRVELERLITFQERADLYMPEISDYSIVNRYVEKLMRFYPNKVTGVVINYDTDASNSNKFHAEPGVQIYNFKFNAVVTFQEAQEIAQMIDNGTQKAKIIGMSMKRFEDESGFLDELEGDRPLLDLEEEVLKVTYDIQLYAVDMGKSTYFGDRYSKLDGFVYQKLANESSGEVNVLSNRPDLRFVIQSFLAGGDNIQIYGKDFATNQFSFNSVTKLNFKAEVGEKKTKLSIKDHSGRYHEILQDTPKRTLVFNLDCDFPRVPDNENLNIDLTIDNRSNQPIRVVIKDTTGKVRILDRNANVIGHLSDLEKVSIF